MAQHYTPAQLLELLTPLFQQLNQEMPFKKQPFNLVSAKGSHYQDQELYDYPLLSRSGQLDSLSLVSFLIRIEDFIQLKTQKNIVLATDRAFSSKNSPFLSVGSLCHFICELLNEKS